MDKFFLQDAKLKELGPLNLAFIGDGVYELLAREKIISQGGCAVNKLHSKKVELVNCAAQAQAAQKLTPLFTQEERDVFMRGRNAHVGHVPKNADIADYHAATALEAVFGYLYLKGDTERIRALFSEIIK